QLLSLRAGELALEFDRVRQRLLFLAAATGQQAKTEQEAGVCGAHDGPRCGNSHQSLPSGTLSLGSRALVQVDCEMPFAIVRTLSSARQMFRPDLWPDWVRQLSHSAVGGLFWNISVLGC